MRYLTVVLLVADTALGCPLGCKCFSGWNKFGMRERADCDGDRSTVFPVKLSKNTTELYMKNYTLHVLNASHFKGLIHMRRLHIYTSFPSYIAEDTFSGLRKLTSLSLSGNGIRSFKKGLFHPLKQLRILHLSTNLLTSLDPEMFRGLDDLVSVDIRNNKLSRIEDYTFSELPKLSHIDISENKLTCVGVFSFSGLNNLKWIDLSQNTLSTIHMDTFLGLVKLKDIFLHENWITHIHGKLFSELENLKHLNLGYNIIQDIEEGAFSNCEQLTLLELNDNKMTSLRQDVFKGALKLSSLDLRNNQIQQILPGAFTGLTKLQLLLLSGNSLTDLHVCTFSGLYKLTRLDLSDNFLTVIRSEVLLLLSHLEDLNLNRNALEFVELHGLDQLRYLHLANNLLYSIRNLRIPESLVSLTLVGNNFNCTCQFLDGLAKIRWSKSLLASCHSPHQVLDANSTKATRLKEWKSMSSGCIKKCGKGFRYQLTPCVHCENTNSPTCTARKGPPNHQCVVLHYEYAHISFPSTNCSNTTCTYPMYCSVESVYEEHSIVNTTTANDFCLAERRRSRKYVYLIFAMVISVGSFIFINSFHRVYRSRRAPPVISNVIPEINENEPNEQNNRQGN